VTLEQRLLRRWPQLAALDSLHHVAEAAIVALCAAHPLIESEHRHDRYSPLDQLADLLVDDAMSMLDALDRYRALLHHRDRLHHGLQNQEECIDDLPF
jgi:hypothetical protein